MIFQNCLKFHSPLERLVKLRITISKYHMGIYAKYHYQSCYYLYKYRLGQGGFPDTSPLICYHVTLSATKIAEKLIGGL